MNARLLFTILIVTLLAFGVYHFQTRYVEQKQLTRQAEKKLATQSRLIEALQTRQQEVAALDFRYLKELADAQRTIENLQRDVAGGTRRLHVAARCPQLPAGAASASLDDAPRAGLTDAAERNYFTLRNRIVLAAKQIAGLQDYIRQQCLRSPEYPSFPWRS